MPMQPQWVAKDLGTSSNLTGVAVSNGDRPILYVVGAQEFCQSVSAGVKAPCGLKTLAGENLTSVSAGDFSDDALVTSDKGTVFSRVKNAVTDLIEWNSVSSSLTQFGASAVGSSAGYVLGTPRRAFRINLGTRRIMLTPLTGIPATVKLNGASLSESRSTSELLTVGSEGFVATLNGERGTDFTVGRSGVTTNLNAVVSFEALGGAQESIAVGDNGVILSRNASGTWVKVDSGVTVNLYGIVYAGAQGIYAVGENGTILNRKLSGNSWVAERSGVPETLRSAAVEFSATTGRTIYVVGDQGTLLTKFFPAL